MKMSEIAPLKHTNNPVGIDWERVKSKVDDQIWASAWGDALGEYFQDHLAVSPDTPPVEETAWSHHYFCDACAKPLDFNLQKPFEHRCAFCDQTYSGPLKDGAWRTWMHGRIMGNLESATILARLRPDPEPYVNYIRKTVLYYAEHYEDYSVHGVNVGKGKIMPQSLDEAIWVISIGRYLQWGKGEAWFSDKEFDVIREKLFRPALELLKPQIHKIHNIHVWLNSAVATCAKWLNDSAMLDWSIHGEFGWENQLKRGVNADGFWCEGSIGYHFYSFRAFASLAQTAADSGITLWDYDSFREMLLAPLNLAYPDGTLPAHNDCWKISLYQCARSYEFGACVWPDAGFDSALSRIYENASPGVIQFWTELPAALCNVYSAYERSSTEAVLFGQEILPAPTRLKQQSRLFKASGLGILENDQIRVCLKAGPHGGKHDHCDKLNVDVIAANGWKSEDLGSSGYGAEITQKWYLQPAAHNIPVVNQQQQGEVAAQMLEFDQERMSGQVIEAQRGLRMNREITLTQTGWKDLCRIEGETTRQLDWCFHGLGQLQTSFAMEEVASAGTEGGFDWLRNVRSGFTDEDWWAEWKLETGSVRMYFKGEAGTEVLIATAEGNPATDKLGVVIVRRNSVSALFEAEFKVKSFG